MTVCAFLLETGACASPRTPAGATPLHRAAYCGHVDVVRLLLGRGADPTLCDDDGATALHKVHLPTDFTSFLCPADGGVNPSLSLCFPNFHPTGGGTRSRRRLSAAPSTMSGTESSREQEAAAPPSVGTAGGAAGAFGSAALMLHKMLGLLYKKKKKN